MRILVTGSRGLDNISQVEGVLSQYIAVKDTVIHGACPSGVDAIADDYARRYFNDVLVAPADWKTHGRAAGPIRNKEMITRFEPDVVVAVWDGVSRGTRNMIDLALKAKIETHVHIL